MLFSIKLVKFKLHYWPVVTTVWLFLTYFSSYLIAVLNGDVYPLFPYISDTGTLPIESCIFGQMLNIGALLMFICMLIRYYQVKIYSNEKYSPKIKLANKWSILFGSIGCLGMSIVANFQETNDMGTHIVGATMAFLIGSLYFIVQTIITFKFEASNLIKFTRLFINVISIPFFVTSMVTAGMASNQFKGDPLQWKPEDAGYTLHLISTLSEWVMAFSLNIYMLTFTGEFRLLKFEGIKFKM